ncbi:MAG: transketolase [Christensenella sp.]|nr:transketolase [Christensenella sp.]
MNTKEMKVFAKEIQMETVKTIGDLGIGHIGGALSVAHVLAVLYGKQMKYDPANPKWDDRDWLVVSKGHAGPAVYSALALRGFMEMEQLKTLNRPGTKLPSHCDMNLTTGIDMTTGSLGQGSSTAAGVALSFKMDGKENYTYLILGDGEIEEGQVWEMALFAAHRKLDHLIAFVDYNKLQIDGSTDEVCALGDIAKKFEAFGWFCQSVDGHDVAAIDGAIEIAKQHSGKPNMIVLNTEKGNGWSSIAGKVSCHNMPINEDQMKEALLEMQAEIDKIQGEK